MHVHVVIGLSDPRDDNDVTPYHYSCEASIRGGQNNNGNGNQASWSFTYQSVHGPTLDELTEDDKNNIKNIIMNLSNHVVNVNATYDFEDSLV